MSIHNHYDVVVIGAGFTGLSIAYELAKSGKKVCVIESEEEIGGLAAAFIVNGERLDRFYHHWFTNDSDVMGLIDELGLENRIRLHATNTGMYYANNIYRLSTPLDLLKFKPLNFIDRIRLGILTLRARAVRDWRALEKKSASQWLTELGGRNVFKVVWEPLLKGKFGPYAEEISAVWFWNKIKLRGGSRGKKGEEKLVYLKGGFVALADALATYIKNNSGELFLNSPAIKIEPDGKRWKVTGDNYTYVGKQLIVTTALPITAKLIEDWAPSNYVESLNRVQYLGNVCLVLELDRPLSDTYWLNVNDPHFPFVGVIEHTNFEEPETYGGRHIVYLSKYLTVDDNLYAMTGDEFLDFSLPFLQKMFPEFKKNWVKKNHLWKSEWSQPVIVRNYSQIIPDENTPFENFYICTMAQIYPEDRGTNYAIREGRRLGKKLK